MEEARRTIGEALTRGHIFRRSFRQFCTKLMVAAPFGLTLNSLLEEVRTFIHEMYLPDACDLTASYRRVQLWPPRNETIRAHITKDSTHAWSFPKDAVEGLGVHEAPRGAFETNERPLATARMF